MNAQQEWKRTYVNAKQAKQHGYKNTYKELLEQLLEYRREAALERKLAVAQREIEAQARQINKAVEVAVSFGGYDEAHHKDWTIDQIVRVLTGDKYDQVIADACNGEDGPNTFTWNTGIAP